jgi:hypothetical protein
MNRILKDKSFRLSIIITFIFLGTGIAFLFLGLADYNWVLFILLPVVLGFSIGAMPNKRYTLLGTLISTLITLMAIFIPGLSGLFCIVMALVIIVPLIFLGYVIAYLAHRYNEIKSTERLPVLLTPLLLFLIAAPAVHYFKSVKEEVIEVKTERVFNYTPEQVYDAIKSVDTLDAEKSFLMYIDLPIPTKCVLEKEEIGGIRTCHFKQGNMTNSDFGSGTITEKITKLERGKILQMDVIDYTLVGRNWLGFKEAIYLFENVGNNHCKMTRVTTYTSALTPRFYWAPIERWGIEQEHEFVFRNIEKDLNRKHRR